jgi:hypothetical protein
MQESCTSGPVSGASSGRRLCSTLPRLTHDGLVAGSSPAGPTIVFNSLQLDLLRLRSTANDSASF